MPDTVLEVPPNSATLVEKDGRFFIFEPGLGVIASDEKVERAYEKFVGARRDYVEEIARAGLTEASAVGPSEARTAVLAGRPMGSELRLFLAKTGIVLLIVAVVVAVVVDRVNRAIGGLASTIEPLETISLADVARKAKEIAIDARELTPDNKETLRQSVGALSRELAPIIDAWRNPPSGSPSTAPNTPRQ
jgi:hypothetical protein